MNTKSAKLNIMKREEIIRRLSRHRYHPYDKYTDKLILKKNKVYWIYPSSAGVMERIIYKIMNNKLIIIGIYERSVLDKGKWKKY